ncbi:ZYRO0C02156p [Zygosaccharomyces rouxii]|uniref:Ras modification protein ERF4 n=1 Tax=Zygosaccharomyces rouxii (strain ATCC 2623 / CBS 732 / NBRC 1130 / NCYC 568 / NRRL Y-229) TaxID=559307 RepID=C5DSQ4_ZYGRC|nr:uncharacterized protein ZYRO0C02156g [Zygosaccharomyces rouxii]KAH9201995.1 Golgin subfamily A member 7/ERF4 family-domain-containing protein [Zygosaccharomyces rouxii]CAR26815.1 ZYRO0C02156p [Zygosaccharomyces rouxii]
MEVLADKVNSVGTVISGSGSRSGTEVPEQALQERAPIFFNYHEFGERYYADVDARNQLREHDEDHGICMTHFPNVYVARGSPEFETTRIVRVPRRFEVTLDCPYFSTAMPGMEPGAITGEPVFQPFGIFDEDGQLFGYSSASPLARVLSVEKFQEIVITINSYLQNAFYTYSWFNLIDLLLEALSLGLWHPVSKYLWRHPLVHLEDYVQQVNQEQEFKEKGVKIISPRRSGYLSVCFSACYNIDDFFSFLCTNNTFNS